METLDVDLPLQHRHRDGAREQSKLMRNATGPSPQRNVFQNLREEYSGRWGQVEWSQGRLEVGRDSQTSEAEVAFAQGIHFRAVNLEAGQDEALAYGDATPSACL